ncbi:ParB N-terminal domain-containing protein [Pasteurella multocida]|uniref:ParB N-terminal domain-containing protein n=1 Tax=Pasteurella multocida TaxID=747 RepID=UPI0021003D82|nr:ParB N-terminal domain-containing protein [Pasteurella multocida]MDY0633015.1 ParB N-terminal domain-containing protein [Pasteurella multocida]
MMKSLFKTRTAEERQQLIRQNMMTTPIANTSPDYKKSIEEIQQSTNDQQPQLINVTLMQLRQFDGNPRKTKNPKFEEIKESIRMRGLDFAPNITKRPGEDFYIIADGGNTRLQALSYGKKPKIRNTGRFVAYINRGKLVMRTKVLYLA